MSGLRETVQEIRRMGQQRQDVVTGQATQENATGWKNMKEILILVVVLGLGSIQAVNHWLHPAAKPTAAATGSYAVAGAPGASQLPSNAGQASGAIYRVFYGPAIDLERVDTEVLGSATKSIDIAMYSQTDENVCAVIATAARRGVAVRVYRDAKEYGHERQHDGGRCTATLVAAGAAVKVKGNGELMHMKSYAVDGYKVRSGSANMSVSGERYQDNDIVLIASADAAAAFEHEFDQLWNRPDNRTVSAAHAFSLP